MSLAVLLRNKTGLRFEVMPEADAQVLAETMIAMANGDGGTVLLGATAEGEVTGDLQPEDAQDALRGALSLCRPLVRTSWEQFEDRRGVAVAIVVERSSELHWMADGRVLSRTSNGNEELSGEKIARLAKTKSTPDFEQEVLPGARRADLDEEVIENYLELRKRRVGRDLKMSDDALLQGIGALTADGGVTVAGMLLFGKNPEFFLPQSGLVYIRYPGNDRIAPAGEPRYLRREEFYGPLALVIERAGALLWQELRGEAVVRGLVREDHYILPQEAVREALVNAMCHRDYRIAGRKVEVSRFEDRLEISSPGGLPAHITVDNMLYEHYSRNPRLVNALYEWKYIEQLGLGVDRMIAEMAAAGYPPPHFDDLDTSFLVTLRRGSGIRAVPLPLDPEISRGLNDRQIRVLQHLVRYERITSGTYRELCPNYTPETLRLDLVDLVEKNLIVKIGDKKGTFYILKQKGLR